MSAAAQNKRNRTAGKAWERTIRDEGRDLSIDVEHIRDTGTLDQGDLVYRIGGHFHVVEAKNTAKLELTPFLRESENEAVNFAVARKLDPALVHPVVFYKRRGFAHLEDGVAVMTVRNYLRLARAVES